MENWLLKRIWVVVGSFAAALLMTVFAFVTKHLSPRGFNVVAIVLVAIYFVAFMMLMRKAQQMRRLMGDSPPSGIDDVKRTRLRRRVRREKVRIAAMPFLFLLAWGLLSDDGLRWGNLVFLALWLCFFGSRIAVLRRMQKQLNQPATFGGVA